MLLSGSRLACGSGRSLHGISIHQDLGSRVREGLTVLTNTSRQGSSGSSGSSSSSSKAIEESNTKRRRPRRHKKHVDLKTSPTDSRATRAAAADKPWCSTQQHYVASKAEAASTGTTAPAAVAALQAGTFASKPAAEAAAAVVTAPAANTAVSVDHAYRTPAASDVVITPTLCELMALPTDSALQFQNAACTLRPYQMEALHQVVFHWKEHWHGLPLVMLPTGCGKTVMFAALARYMHNQYAAAFNIAPIEAMAGTEAAAAAAADAQGWAGHNRDPSPGMSVGAVAAAAAGNNAAWKQQGAGAAAIQTPAAGKATGALQATAAADSVVEAAASIIALEQQAEEIATSAAAEDATAARSFGSWRKKHSELNLNDAATATTAHTAAARPAAAPAASLMEDSCSDSAAGFGSSSTSTPASHETGSSSSTDTGSGSIALPVVDSSKHSSSKRTGDSVDSSTCNTSGDSGRSTVTSTTAGHKAASSSSTATIIDTAQQPVQQDEFRVLVLAHRFDLLRQAEDKFTLMWPGCTVSWVKGGRKEFYGQVVVASVGSAVNCITQLLACKFNLVIVDEAHHSVANTYLDILKGLGFLKEELQPVPVKPGSSSSASPFSSIDEDPPEGQSFGDAMIAAGTLNDQRQQDIHQLDLADLAIINSSSSSSSRTGSQGVDDDASSSSSSPEVRLVPVLTAVHNPNSLCVGFTATPYRMKKVESEQLYNMFTIVFSKTISEMIRNGYLSKVLCRKVLTHVDLKGVSSTAGDFVTSQLSSLVNSKSRNRLVLAGYLDYCTEPDTAASVDTAGSILAHEHALQKQSKHSTSTSSGSSSSDHDDDDTAREELPLLMDGRRAVRKAIGFAVDIKHAAALDELFQAAGIRCAAVHSKLPQEEANARIMAFRRGQLDVLWNCEKLTEGFDEPSINAVLMARPTKSRGLYKQMLGRGLRQAPGKDSCLVLDFTDKYHKADAIIDVRVILPEGDYVALDKLPPRPEEPDMRPKVDSGMQAGGEINVLQGDADPFDYAWMQIGQYWTLSVFNDGTLWLVKIADIGPQQRQHLGLLDASSTAEQQEGQQHPPDDAEGEQADNQGQDDSGYDLQDRYVVLHQPSSRAVDPLEWHHVAPLAKHGMTQADAYGAAVDHVHALIYQRQAKMVSRKVSSKHLRRLVPVVDSYRKDARWRSSAASEKQLRMLDNLKVKLPPGKLTKGHASDLLSAAMASPATPEQYQQLQRMMSPEATTNPPVPLLYKHASDLLAATGPSSSSRQQAAARREHRGQSRARPKPRLGALQK